MLSLFQVVTMASISVVLLVVVVAVVPFTGILYAVYFGCVRPLWIWSDRFRYAHFLWIEEVAPGVYQRNEIGKMKHLAFRKLNPQLKEIKLV